LVHTQQAADARSPCAAVELDYLTTLGLADRLPVWQEQCTTLLQEGGANE
jgi:hypothetical protein